MSATRSLVIFQTPLFLLLLGLLLRLISCSADGTSYVRDACSVTHYRDICIRSLSSYSNTARRNPHKWAQAAVTITMAEAKSTERFLNVVKASGRLRRKQRVALLDCLEVLENVIYNVEKSLGELRRLEAKNFELQMGNVETWMSAALTDEDTCLDGFDGVRRGKEVRVLKSKVRRTSYVTSNALALVGKLASVGARGI